MSNKSFFEQLKEVDWLQEIHTSQSNTNKSGIGMGIALTGLFWFVFLGSQLIAAVALVQTFFGLFVAFHYQKLSFEAEYIEKIHKYIRIFIMHNLKGNIK